MSGAGAFADGCIERIGHSSRLVLDGVDGSGQARDKPDHDVRSDIHRNGRANRAGAPEAITASRCELLQTPVYAPHDARVSRPASPQNQPHLHQRAPGWRACCRCHAAGAVHCRAARGAAASALVHRGGRHHAAVRRAAVPDAAAVLAVRGDRGSAGRRGRQCRQRRPVRDPAHVGRVPVAHADLSRRPCAHLDRGAGRPPGAVSAPARPRPGGAGRADGAAGRRGGGGRPVPPRARVSGGAAEVPRGGPAVPAPRPVGAAHPRAADPGRHRAGGSGARAAKGGGAAAADDRGHRPGHRRARPCRAVGAGGCGGGACAPCAAAHQPDCGAGCPVRAGAGGDRGPAEPAAGAVGPGRDRTAGAGGAGSS